MPKKYYRLGGVDFQFDEAEPTESALSALDKDFKRDREQLVGTSDMIIVRAYASKPGSEDYNEELSQKRGERLKSFLVDKGIDANRIEVRAMGEQDIQTKMAEAGPQPDLDDPSQRTAFYEVRMGYEEPEVSEFAATGVERANTQADDWRNGLEALKKIVEPTADLIRNEEKLPDNPAGAAPSDNPAEFVGQVFDIVKDTLKEALKDPLKAPLIPYKALLKGIAGSVAEVAISNQADEVRDARVPYYKALGLALGTIDKDFRPEADGMLDGMTGKQLALHESLKSDVSKLSPYLSYCVGLVLVGQAKGGLLTKERDAIVQMLEGINIAEGARLFFQDPEYSHNDNHDETGLSFVEKDGKVEILDPRPAVEAGSQFNVVADAAKVYADGPGEGGNMVEVDSPDDFTGEGALLPPAQPESETATPPGEEAKNLLPPDPDENDGDVNPDGDGKEAEENAVEAGSQFNVVVDAAKVYADGPDGEGNMVEVDSPDGFTGEGALLPPAQPESETATPPGEGAENSLPPATDENDGDAQAQMYQAAHDEAEDGAGGDEDAPAQNEVDEKEIDEAPDQPVA